MLLWFPPSPIVSLYNPLSLVDVVLLCLIHLILDSSSHSVVFYRILDDHLQHVIQPSILLMPYSNGHWISYDHQLDEGFLFSQEVYKEVVFSLLKWVGVY